MFRVLLGIFAIFCSIQISKSAPPLQRIEIVRPDHLEGVPLERDGSLNREFRQEIIFGGDESSAKAISKDSTALEIAIREMFYKADVDSNGLLTKEELKNQIMENTRKHMDDGKKEAEEAFQEVDTDGDGKVTWEEYLKKFLLEKKLVDAEHINEHEEHAFDVETRRMIDEEKLTFEGADADGDGLDTIEWLGFQHPEHSEVMLKGMAEEIMKAFDENRDGVLSRDEFSKDAPGLSTDPEMDAAYKKEREKEFDTEIDQNHDGQASLKELLDFVNPRNERHANQEVEEIMDIADSNKDEKLSLAELLDNAAALADSAFVKVKKRLHDDL
uniref:EF-hand domain-containing protein n=1 Tax=Panagrolaimus sp. JU765 TaxID=591449 RepID=A0AC34QDU7_9BILA